MIAMYIAAGMVVLVFLCAYLLARGEPTQELTGKVFALVPFYKIAMYLYTWGTRNGRNWFADTKVIQFLELLHPGEERHKVVKDFYVKKLALSLAVCFAGTILGVAVSAQATAGAGLNAQGGIIRGDFEDQPVEVELEGRFPDGTQRFRVEVGNRQLSSGELEAFYESFLQELSKLVLGNNVSWSEVRENLMLWEEYSGYPFKVAWSSSVPEVLSANGTVEETDVAQEIMLEAILRYDKWEKRISRRVVVIPPELTEAERIFREREDMLVASEANSRNSESWILPTMWEGDTVHWKRIVEDHGFLLWGIAMSVTVLLFFLADKDLADHVEMRRQNMKRDYPDLIHKLVLYMGAGMTIRGSLFKLAEDYAQKQQKDKRPIYEEVLYTCRELQTGVSEIVAYEHFGKRCGVQEYIRLVTLLTQNLKKGNSTLLQRLQEEAQRANEEHLQFARKKGEEAQTKLLLPMVMLLLVVMLVLILPAFGAVGI
ncbi:MAG: type II secretion system F family protein [Lachnospiraceae bacterium]|nr:type II secretion system F family protein [Lachnospiraceae bacterium]